MKKTDPRIKEWRRNQKANSERQFAVDNLKVSNEDFMDHVYQDPFGVESCLATDPDLGGIHRTNPMLARAFRYGITLLTATLKTLGIRVAYSELQMTFAISKQTYEVVDFVMEYDTANHPNEKGMIEQAVKNVSDNLRHAMTMLNG